MPWGLLPCPSPQPALSLDRYSKLVNPSLPATVFNVFTVVVVLKSCIPHPLHFPTPSFPLFFPAHPSLLFRIPNPSPLFFSSSIPSTQKTFFACLFCFPNIDHVTIPRRVFSFKVGHFHACTRSF